MEGKIAIVTGASQGIGEAISNGLACDGYQTILIARNIKKLDQVKQKILKSNPTAPKPKLIPLDVTNSDEIYQTIDNIISQFGKISVLVNNAGIYYTGTLDGKEEELKKMLDVNLVAPFVFIKGVAAYMKKEGSGYIFNISSRAGKIGYANSGIYSASKFGISGLSESFYRELSESGINVTSICPGWVNTDMAFDAKTPLKEKEMIQPDDIMNTIRYVLNLSKAACLKEIVLECKKSIV